MQEHSQQYVHDQQQITERQDGAQSVVADNKSQRSERPDRRQCHDQIGQPGEGGSQRFQPAFHRGALRGRQSQHRGTEKQRDDQHLQQDASAERAHEIGWEDVGQEGSEGDVRGLRKLVAAGRKTLHAHPDPGEIGSDQAKDQRDGGNNLEVDQRA
jgi:hypothetical protein